MYAQIYLYDNNKPDLLGISKMDVSISFKDSPNLLILSKVIAKKNAFYCLPLLE